MSTPSDFRGCIGPLPAEPKDKRRLRFHQGWWRTFVLGEPAGRHPVRPEETICNMLVDGEESLKNLIDEGARLAAKATLDARTQQSPGLIDQRRLYNNLLSSQPLVFNFFGRLKQDLALASSLVQAFIPEIDEVTDVRFEFAPEDWIDNSAFDVALVVKAKGRTGILGLECKFTETFSPTEYKNERYRAHAARSGAFPAPYESYLTPQFNQLFRNQLIAESLVIDGGYEFRMTGLFCYQGDSRAIETGRAFQAQLRDGAASFHIITFAAFIEALQRLPLSWEQREWTMVLWARYCALSLSDASYLAYE
jgi:hypothetical protein